jgi:hypothetical protein
VNWNEIFEIQDIVAIIAPWNCNFCSFLWRFYPVASKAVDLHSKFVFKRQFDIFLTLDYFFLYFFIDFRNGVSGYSAYFAFHSSLYLYF